jgi:lipopolysaccharide transport system ATP-binding protein
MASVKRLCNRCIVLSNGKKIFDGDTDTAISIYMREEAMEATFFDTSKLSRNSKCNKRKIINSLEILEKDSNHFEYGEKFKFRMRWNNENVEEPVKLKMVITGSDLESAGVAFGGQLKQIPGENETDFIFDTKLLVPGQYTMHFKLYDEDQIGNVVYYDQCKGIKFFVEHGENSIHLKHWFSDWGHVVLPCLKQI